MILGNTKQAMQDEKQLNSLHGHFSFSKLSLCCKAVLLATSLTVIASPTMAEGTESATAEQRQYSVASGELSAALSQFAKQANITLLFTPEQLQGLKTTGLNATYTVEQALQYLLSGTGLSAQKGDYGYVISGKLADGVVVLPNINVSATNVSETATSPVQGYVATRSSTASKTDLAIVETARHISVVSAEQISDRNSLTVENAVAYVSGVRIGDSGLDPRFDQITIRGFAATTNADFLDGLRQPNTGWLSYYTSDPYSLERVEVLKGPASVLYGYISPGGMVNRVSKRPSDAVVNEVEVQAGNNDHYQAQFDMGGSVNDDVQYRVVGLVRDAETDIEWVNNDMTFLAPSLSWKISDDTKVTFLANYQDRLTSGSPRPYQQGDNLTRFWAGDEGFDKLEQCQFSLGYEFEHRFNDTLTFQQNLRFGDVDTTNQYADVDGTVDGHTLSRTAYGVYEEMQSLSVDNRAVFSFNTAALEHTLVAGLDYTNYDSDVVYAYGDAPDIDMWAPDHNQQISKPANVIVDYHYDTELLGFYLQDQIEINQWRLSAGLRRDKAETTLKDKTYATKTKQDVSKTTGQVGALYLFDSGWAPYASYATSFVPLSGTDAYGDAYKPTEGTQYEVGLKYQPPGSQHLITASLYHLTQSNVQTRDPNNALNSIQTGEQEAKGIELEAAMNFSEQFKLVASYSFNDAEITKNNDGTEGNRPANTPKHLASVWGDYTFEDGALSGIGLGAGARWVGSSYGSADNIKKNKDYAIADMVMHYDIGSSKKGIRLALNATNLFDNQYINCESGYCYRGEGRSVVGSVRYRW